MVMGADAHNAILNFEAGKSFFAVYDGHGGHEVAAYCALNLPNFIKNNEAFKRGDYAQVLEESFIAFDARMTERSVVEELKRLAGCGEAEEEKTEEEKAEEHSEVNHLCEEASMPIEAVIAKLASGGGGAAEAAAEEVVAGSGGSSSNCDAHRPENHAMRRLKDEKKPTSPFLRAKPGPLGLLQGPKHIHFNEDGSERKNGDSVEGEQEESKAKTDEIKEEDKAEAAPATPVNGEPAKEESESLQSSPE